MYKIAHQLNSIEKKICERLEEILRLLPDEVKILYVATWGCGMSVGVMK